MANTSPPTSSSTMGDGDARERDAARQTAERDLADLRSKAEEDLHGVTETARRDFEDARDAAARYAESRKNDAADQVESVASAVRRVADEIEKDTNPMIGRYAREMGDGLARLSESVRNRSLADIFGDVQRFGREHPAGFLAGAALLGFAASRFMAASSSQSRSMSGSGDYARSGATSPDTARVAAPAALNAGKEDF